MSGRVSERRDAIAKLAWNIATRMEVFTYYDLSSELHIEARRVAVFVRDWQRAGAVEACGKRGNRRAFRVVDARRPALMRADGTAIRRESPAGNMWRVARRLTVFTPSDVMSHANTPTCEVTLAAAQEFCQMLNRAGYLKVLQRAAPGRREAAYRLIRDTGPLPPRERRVRAVYDENLDEFTHLAGGL
ncbi:hypothetical protein ROE7235_03887 [Roseibaca ekhonensis]|uniref:Uncharacterized protein n=1 Tax=Roseinatronobacter ekhonensis TaxID=254356 RepID=A0A3B0MDZ0_9RHOB|nr:hypothetical protein [Roseibaca ekhonensis]SUZ34105.1 hypothetical protein ROE7235_03887 [Roseibaca ekhonensis]